MNSYHKGSSPLTGSGVLIYEAAAAEATGSRSHTSTSPRDKLVTQNAEISKRQGIEGEEPEKYIFRCRCTGYCLKVICGEKFLRLNTVYVASPKPQ